MDQALERRLRNLSHAVNVQMLRSGLAQTLLPISLLDAVLKGQIETQPTATNVLRLRLPLAVGELDQGMDVLCVLLRSNDLEFDSPVCVSAANDCALTTMLCSQWCGSSVTGSVAPWIVRPGPIGRPHRIQRSS